MDSSTAIASRMQPEDFVSGYQALREQEQWTCTDAALRQLPIVSKTDPHAIEWKIRAQSAAALVAYFKQRSGSLLEVGCGNGWLSNLLARETTLQVTGLDCNPTEIEQAQRVFGTGDRLNFIQGYFPEAITPGKNFDYILFAASFHYFSEPAEMIQTALAYCKPGGELHIKDSPFYSNHSLAAARDRSANYFTKLGFPGMLNYYHHHSRDIFKNLKHTVLYQPGRINRLMARLKGKAFNPFCWICIPQEQ